MSWLRKFLRSMSCILIREWEEPRVSGFFFKAMVQAVLLFKSETWMVNPCMGKALGGGSDPGGEMADGTAPAEDTGREVEMHLGSNGKGGGGVIDNGGIHQAAPEYGRIVHRYAITVRPV